NPYNPAPEKEVRFGLQTWDEMMVGWIAYVWERPETAAELAKQPVNQADLLFDRLDRNGDGVLTMDEIPEQMRPLLRASGTPVAERLTREAFRQLYEDMRLRLRRNRPAPNPGGGAPPADGKPAPEKPSP